MPFLPISRLLLLLFTPLAQAGSVAFLVQHSPLAGSQYYAARERWPELKVGDLLTLTREAENRHDRHAVRIDWRGEPIGYVPRSENRAVASALDQGEKLEARITRLRSPAEARNPWQRIEFAIYLLP